jgi:hypothetical protein
MALVEAGSAGGAAMVVRWIAQRETESSVEGQVLWAISSCFLEILIKFGFLGQGCELTWGCSVACVDYSSLL